MPWKCKACGRVMMGFSADSLPPSHACDAKEPMPRKLQLLINAANTAMKDQAVAKYIWDHTRSEQAVDSISMKIREMAGLRDAFCDWKQTKDDYTRGF